MFIEYILILINQLSKLRSFLFSYVFSLTFSTSQLQCLEIRLSLDDTNTSLALNPLTLDTNSNHTESLSIWLGFQDLQK
jgi:hypothetical protein